MRLTANWLEQFETFRAGKPLAELTAADLTRWRQELTWRPGPSGRLYSESTLNQAVGVVRRFFAWLVTRGELDQDPSQHLKTRRPASPPRQRQLGELLDQPDPHSLTGLRDRAILGVLHETGVAAAACCRLDLDHLQLDTGALLTLGRRRQVHSLSDALLANLAAYLDFSRPQLAGQHETALFLSTRGRRLSPPAIYQVLRRHTL